jgi:hypothetical protein
MPAFPLQCWLLQSLCMLQPRWMCAVSTPVLHGCPTSPPCSPTAMLLLPCCCCCSAFAAVPYGSIAKIESWPIAEHPGYSVVSLGLGAGSSSRYWLYFFPSQVIKARVAGHRVDRRVCIHALGVQGYWSCLFPSQVGRLGQRGRAHNTNTLKHVLTLCMWCLLEQECLCVACTLGNVGSNKLRQCIDSPWYF